MTSLASSPAPNLERSTGIYEDLLESIVGVIHDERVRFAQTVNAALVLTYLRIGQLISERSGRVLAEQKAVEGGPGRGRPGLAKLRKRLAEDIQACLPEARFATSERTLRYAQTLFESWSRVPENFGKSLLPKMSWTSHVALLDDCAEAPDQLVWYARQAIEQGWSSKILRHQIKAGAYARQGGAASNFEQSLGGLSAQQAQEMVSSPVLLPLLAGPRLLELELKSQLLDCVRDFLLSLGTGFTFKGVEVVLPIGETELRADLVLFNTELLCWVVVELKIEAFEAAFAGQLDAYVRLVDERMRRPQHHPTIGILLCPGGDGALVRFSLLGMASPIAVATYEFTAGNRSGGALPPAISSVVDPDALRGQVDKAYRELTSSD